MLSHFVGPETNLEVGHEYERPDAEAIRMIEAGHALPVRESEVETTSARPAKRKATK